MKLTKLILAAAAAIATSGAMADTANSNIALSANVAAACNITAGPLAFGTYNPLGAAAQASASLSIACTQGTAPVISLGAGQNATGSQRKLKTSGTDTLNYSLYQPLSNAAGAACAYTTAWGDGTALGTTLTTTAAPSLTARSYNVCGQIPTGQNAAVGSYADSVVATITF